MASVAIYCRVSTEDQAERGTIESQVEFATKYCDLHKLTVAEWYIDDGVTGTLPLEARTAGAKLLTDAAAHRFETLLVYRLDRLGRSARITLNAVYDLERHGVRVRSMTEPFDTSDASGRFMLTILAGQADYERSTILDRLWHGANRHARAGEWLGGIVPYGYVVVDKRLAVDDEPLPGLAISRAEVVRTIYRLSADQDMTCRAIAEHLNARGIPPSYAADGRTVRRGERKQATAGIWRPGRIRNMLVNTTYKGVHVYGQRTEKRDRERIAREVPAIVDVAMWDRAQRVLREHQLTTKRNTTREYLLRGLIRCGECGLVYTGTYYAGARQKPVGYYLCGGKTVYRGPKDGKCRSQNIPQEWVEDLVWEACVRFIREPGEAVRALAESMAQRLSQRDKLQADLESVEAAIADHALEREAIMDLYRRRLITNSEVESQLAKSATARDALVLRAEDLRATIRGEDSLADQAATAEALLDTLRERLDGELTFEARRSIVRTLVQAITVTAEDGPNGRPRASVTVSYRFSPESKTLKDKGSSPPPD